MGKEDLKLQAESYLDYFPNNYLEIFKFLGEEKKDSENEQLTELLNTLSLQASFELANLGSEDAEKEFQELLRQLQLEYFKEKKQQLFSLIKEAEEKGDSSKLDRTLEEFDKVSKTLNEEELNQIKEQITGNYLISNEDSYHVLSDLLISEIKGDAKESEKFVERIKNVKLEDVKKLALNVGKSYSFFALVPE